MAAFTSKEDEHFFAAIGRLTISWAHIEFGIDGFIVVIHQRLGGKQIARDLPRTGLNRKLEYIRKWLQTVPEPTFCLAVTNLMNDIKKASHDRHDIIHGFIVEQAEGTGEAKMVRLLRGVKELYDQKQYTTSTVKILTCAVEANGLATRALRLYMDLVEGTDKLLKEID